MLGRYPTHRDPLLTFRHPFQASSAARITATLRFEPHLILGVVHLPLLASPWPRLVENRTSPSEWCVCERSDVGVTYLRLHFRRSPHGEHQGLLRLSDSPTCSVRLDNENGYDDQNHFFCELPAHRHQTVEWQCHQPYSGFPSHAILLPRRVSLRFNFAC
jgi:hypothetical protein